MKIGEIKATLKECLSIYVERTGSTVGLFVVDLTAVDGT
jgi:hypothetical protein